MNGPLRTLRARLVVSHLVVVVVGVLTVAFVTGPLTTRFFHEHVLQMPGMSGMMGGRGMTGTVVMVEDLEAGLVGSFRTALLVALLVSTGAALVASTIAASRVLRPLDAVRRAVAQLAEGDYRVRVPEATERELAAVATDINTLAERLETTEERRVRMINEIAHELRTPLTTIEGYMEGLLDGVLAPSEEIFAATAREAARLKRLAEDLSTLSRAEEGALRLETTRIDLAGIAATVAERLRPLFLDKGVELEVATTVPLPVEGDVDRLTQVFVNLVGNALTHTPPGGTVRVAGETSGAFALVTVSDTGRGIPADQLERIFERFHRIDPRLPGGTGIGLTVARGIARLHGGDVSAASPGPGRGATFTVRLPLAR